MGLDNPLHIIFIVVVLLLLFGAKRLPEIGRSLGTGMREFKQSVTGEATSHNHDTHQQTLPPGGAQQAPAPPPTPQQAAPAPVPSSAQANAQDAFAQRDPASTEQR
jgi:sec-independent protein translocase protein TatA